MRTPDVQVDRTFHAPTTADEAWELLSRVYMRVRPHTSSPPASVSVETAATPGLAVDRAGASAAVCRFDANPGQLHLLTVLGGHLGVDAGRGGHVSVGPGECYLHLPDRAADLVWDELDISPVRLSQLEVAAQAAALSGLPEDEFRFLSPRPVSITHGQVWVRTAAHIGEQLRATPDSSLGALLHRGLLDLAAVTALEAFPNTAVHRGYLPSPGDVRPAAVRRAVAYVDAHLSLPITLRDAADAAGTSPHALRAAFRQHLGTTFAAHLRRARCDAARHDLADADLADADLADAEHAGAVDATALDEVAVRWGFTGAADLRAALDDDRRGR